jgi:hypothetical protein
MVNWLRFPDLKAKGVVKNRAQLKNLINNYGFPPGKLLTPNCRAHEEHLVDDWCASRPTERKAVPRSPGRPRKAQVETEAGA